MNSALKPITEEEVRLLLTSGQEKDFRLLYKRYSAALYGVLLKIVREEALAQDLLQEAFVKIWKHAPSYDASKGTAFTWMLNITRNLALDKLRSASYKQGRQSIALDQYVNIHEHPSHEPEINQQELQQLVNTLEPQQRTLIDLVYIQGYTQAEVAENLQIPLGTVKTRIRAALVLLRKQMTPLIPANPHTQS